jgi:hypothetical protein
VKGNRQSIFDNLFRVSPAHAPKRHPALQKFNPHRSIFQVFGCDGVREFNLGACPLEVKDVQAGLKASHITPFQILFNLAFLFIPGGEVVDAAEPAIDAAGDLIPGGVQAMRGIPGEAMDDLIEKTAQTTENDGNLADGTKQGVDDFKALNSTPAKTIMEKPVPRAGGLGPQTAQTPVGGGFESGVVLAALLFRLSVITVKRIMGLSGV